MQPIFFPWQESEMVRERQPVFSLFLPLLSFSQIRTVESCDTVAILRGEKQYHRKLQFIYDKTFKMQGERRSWLTCISRMQYCCLNIDVFHLNSNKKSSKRVAQWFTGSWVSTPIKASLLTKLIFSLNIVSIRIKTTSKKAETEKKEKKRKL